MCKKHFSLSRILINVSFSLSLIEINLWENRQFFHKNNGLTPLQNVDFLDFFRTSLFRSKKHSFLSRILKNLSFSLSLTKINIWENRRFFDKNHELTPLQKVHFWTFLKLYFSGLKSIFFLFRISKNVFFRRSMIKTNIWGKCRVFDKNYGLTPLQNVHFLTLTMD